MNKKEKSMSLLDALREGTTPEEIRECFEEDLRKALKSIEEEEESNQKKGRSGSGTYTCTNFSGQTHTNNSESSRRNSSNHESSGSSLNDSESSLNNSDNKDSYTPLQKFLNSVPKEKEKSKFEKVPDTLDTLRENVLHAAILYLSALGLIHSEVTDGDFKALTKMLKDMEDEYKNASIFDELLTLFF